MTFTQNKSKHFQVKHCIVQEQDPITSLILKLASFYILDDDAVNRKLSVASLVSYLTRDIITIAIQFVKRKRQSMAMFIVDT